MAKDEKNAQLTDFQYEICRLGGTERPFSGEYWNNHEHGLYYCVCCGAILFSSSDKFDSGTGWPSYTQPSTSDALKEVVDDSLGIRRIEVLCKNCNAHLGHVFPDGPKPSGMRYCINSAALRFEPEKSK